jgi:hypothetical protein
MAFLEKHKVGKARLIIQRDYFAAFVAKEKPLIE